MLYEGIHTMAKEHTQIVDWDIDGLTLTLWAFGADRKTDEALGTYDLTELPEVTAKFLFTYGGKQKLADSVSAKTDLADKVEGIDEMWARLLAGDVEAKGGFGGTLSTEEKKANFRKCGLTEEMIDAIMAGEKVTQKEKIATKKAEKLAKLAAKNVA
jgi:hypothetical protein